jgi:hypothetical protein
VSEDLLKKPVDPGWVHGHPEDEEANSYGEEHQIVLRCEAIQHKQDNENWKEVPYLLCGRA